MGIRSLSSSSIATGAKRSKVWDQSAVVIVPNSYESIATINGDGSSGTISFTSIPSTYKHLQLRITALGTSGAGGYPTSLAYFRINSDSGANYKVHSLNGSGSAASSFNGSNNGDFLYVPGGNTSYYCSAVIDILDYTDTSKVKVLRSLNGSDRNGSGYIFLNSMLWNSTAAINTISLSHDATYGGAFTTGSKFALYGIKG